MQGVCNAGSTWIIECYETSSKAARALLQTYELGKPSWTFFPRPIRKNVERSHALHTIGATRIMCMHEELGEGPKAHARSGIRNQSEVAPAETTASEEVHRGHDVT